MSAILPHHISCAVFVQSILLRGKGGDVWSDEIPLEYQQKLLISALKLIPNSDMRWSDFQTGIQALLDKDMLSNILKDIYGNQNIEQLMEFIKVLELLFDGKEQVLKNSSVLGLFFRRLILDFKKLSFEEVIKLALSIHDYINDPNQTISVGEQSDETTMDVSSMEQSLLEEEKENVVQPSDINHSSVSTMGTPTLSRNKAVRFVTDQVNLIESNDYTAMNPKEIKEKTDQLQKLHPDIYEVYYLCFLNYLRVSETNKATVALQMYFDYKVFQDNKSDEEISALEKHQLKFKRFRYCALNLGIMHCHHGNYSEALISLEEAVRIAQETNDKKCLNHAMFWLSLVKEEVGCTHEGENHLRQFIADTKNDLVQSDGTVGCQVIDFLGLLRFIKLQAIKGGEKPAKLLSTVTQLIICNASTAKSAELVRSMLLELYGFSSMATITAQNVLQSLPSNALQNSMSISGEELAMSLCCLANHHINNGFYDEAFLIFSYVKDKFPLYSKHHKTISLCEMKAHFRQAIAEREIDQAVPICKSLYKLDKLEGKYAFTIVDVLYGNFSKAYKSVKEMLEKDINNDLGSSTRPVLKVQLSLLEIDILLLSANPSQAVFKILDLIPSIESKHMKNLKIDANIYLMQYQLQQGLVSKAEALLNEMIIDALANGTCLQKGMLFFLQYQCLKSGSKINSDADKSTLLHSLSLLDKCLQHFSKGNFKQKIKDVYNEQAITFNKLDYIQERNKSSTQYRLLHERLKEMPNVLLF